VDLTHLGVRNWSLLIHIYSNNGFFGLQNIIVPFIYMEFYFFTSTLNIIISQMVRNDFVRYNEHLDIQVIYKILLLEVPKKAPI
jgi:hypothetical protein